MVDRQRARDMNEAAAQFADALAESYRIVYGQAARTQERQGQLAREFSDRVRDYLKEQGESGRATSEQLVDQARRQQEAGRAVAKESVDAYLDFLDNAFSRYQAGTEQATGRAQEGVRAASQTATGVVGAVTDTAAKTTRTAAQAATGQPPIDGYDEMSVDEIAGRLEGLSSAELQRTRTYEQRNKNRETLIERIDQRIRATS
jgi:hypothetical protein